MDKFISVCLFILTFFVSESVQQIKKFYMQDDCDGGNSIYMAPRGIFSAQLQPSRWSRYRANMMCSTTIYAPPGQRLLLVFRSLDIEFEPNCDDDFMKLYDGNSTSANKLAGLPMRICGSRKPTGSFFTSGEALTVFFKTDSWSNEDGFKLIFTSFHEGPCKEGEFTCASGKCIDGSLECDNINNCGDKSDECHLTAEAILGIALGVLLVTFVAIAIVTYVKRRRKATEFANLKSKEQVFNIHSHVHAMSQQHKTCSSCGEDTFNINTKNHMTEKALHTAAELPT